MKDVFGLSTLINAFLIKNFDQGIVSIDVKNIPELTIE